MWKPNERSVENPRGPCNGKAKCKGRQYRVMKGNSYGSLAILLVAWARHSTPDPNHGQPFIGFRCAKSEK